ncbi:MAG: GTP 3',8-cyclase MoaA [Ignisphaera sp.]
MIMDRYGRLLKELRIIVNTECNLSCIYCHREGIMTEPNVACLTPKEYELIAEVASRLGIEKFKLTGGEPLLHKDIVGIVKLLANVKPKDLSLTTNGTLLSTYASTLVNAGLKRVNISLPSLNRNTYIYITKTDSLEQTINGIKVAYDAGLKPITLNIVVLKGITEKEYDKFVDFASRIEGRLRFIELEPIGMGRNIFEQFFERVDKITKYIEKNSIKKYIRDENARPVYILDNGVEVEVIKWHRNPMFCASCHRVRLVYDGTLRPCIASSQTISIVSCLRPSIDVICLEEAFIKVNELRRPFWLNMR